MNTLTPQFPLCHVHRIQRNRYCRICSQWYCYRCRSLHRIRDFEIMDLEASKREIIHTFDGLLPLIRRSSLDTYYQIIKIATEMLYEYFNFRDIARTKRIGSWNLKHVTDSIENSHRLDSICSIITKYRFDVIAVQEIKQEAVRALVNRLNDKVGRRDWKYASANETNISGAFLYKCIPWINDTAELMIHRNDIYCRKPVSAQFVTNTNNWRFKLVNFHLRPRNETDNKKNNDDEVAGLTQYFVDTHSNDAGDLILLGDFNCIPNSSALTSRGYTNIFSVKEYTNTKLFDTYDNIIISHKLHPRCVDHGICGTSFKRRRSIAGKQYPIEGAKSVVGISDHLPIWADFAY